MIKGVVAVLGVQTAIPFRMLGYEHDPKAFLRLLGDRQRADFVLHGLICLSALRKHLSKFTTVPTSAS
jgi:hypothetical protein